MSTEHQRYSTENQSQAIHDYAKRHGMQIVRSYADQGKSGLSIGGRDGLKRLIGDVEQGRADFAVVLVYDISRWGRFQDADESAYYEYICKKSGIRVEYCAEQFGNDGSIGATVMKSIKRAMAGEYSRELSIKVFAGQCRLVEKGFRQGGVAGFGLRRQLIDQDGQSKGILAYGERKSLQTDRTILVPGPEHEVESVRWMYRAFVEEGKREREIAEILNRSGQFSHTGNPWTQSLVQEVLTNEKYIGNNVFNRVSVKLKGRRVFNTPEMWVRKNKAFDPIVPEALFMAAKALIEERRQRLTDQEMLDRLKALLDRVGTLSGFIIDQAEDMPSHYDYCHRFGGLLQVYRLVGFTPAIDYRYLEINRFLRQLHGDVVVQILEGIALVGGIAVIDPETDLLLVNGEFTASLVVARAISLLSGRLRWKVRLDSSLRPDLTVVARMDADNQLPRDYYLLPRIDIHEPKVHLHEDNGLWLDAYRFDTLDALYALASRAPLEKAA